MSHGSDLSHTRDKYTYTASSVASARRVQSVRRSERDREAGTSVTAELNIGELAALLRAKRGRRGLRAVAEEIGDISASTLSRVEQGKVPDLETFVRLCQWLEVSPERFIPSTSHERMSTPEIVTAHLRADRVLDPKTIDALATMIHLAFEAAKRGAFDDRR